MEFFFLFIVILWYCWLLFICLNYFFFFFLLVACNSVFNYGFLFQFYLVVVHCVVDIFFWLLSHEQNEWIEMNWIKPTIYMLLLNTYYNYDYYFMFFLTNNVRWSWRTLMFIIFVSLSLALFYLCVQLDFGIYYNMKLWILFIRMNFMERGVQHQWQCAFQLSKTIAKSY